MDIRIECSADACLCGLFGGSQSIFCGDYHRRHRDGPKSRREMFGILLLLSIDFIGAGAGLTNSYNSIPIPVKHTKFQDCCCFPAQRSTFPSSYMGIHLSIFRSFHLNHLRIGLSSGEGSDSNKRNREVQFTSELSATLQLPETCIIVSKERMLSPGMTASMHLYDQNNLAALNESLSHDGMFCLVRFENSLFRRIQTDASSSGWTPTP